MKRLLPLRITLALVLLFCTHNLSAQLPACNLIYCVTFSNPAIYNYDPSLPVSATNPVLNTFSLPPGYGSNYGLTVSPVLGSTNTTPTFYIACGGTYRYYNPTNGALINTGHSTGVGTTNPINPAAGGGYIFNFDPYTGNVYRYDGTGNSILLTTVAGAANNGPVDLAADCEGNWYFFEQNTAPQFLRKYNAAGMLLQSWTISNPNNLNVFCGGGIAIIGNQLIANNNNNGGVAAYTIGATVLTLNNTTPLGLGLISDMGNCAISVPTTPAVTISASQNTICSGIPVTFTASPVSGGPSPVYQWEVNGMAVGVNSPTYTYNPTNGDVVTVNMTSNSPCANPLLASSNAITMVVNPATPLPGAISGPAYACLGNVLSYSVVQAGGAASYNWALPPGWMILSGQGTASITALADTTSGTVQISLNSICGLSAPATRSVIIGPSAPGLSITTPTTNVCEGATATFTAHPVGGGATPYYQWQKNGLNVGTNSTVYTDVALATGDAITLTMTASSACNGNPTVMAGPVIITLQPNVVPGININTVPPVVLCAGNQRTFTTNINGGGLQPAYQWYKNGLPIASATAASYTTNQLADGDTITVLLTSSLACAAPPTILSNKVGLTVQANVIPAVTISVSPGTTVAPGQLVTFTATATGGGSSPTFQWKKNGQPIPFATGNPFATTALQDGDQISVQMTSYDPCAAPGIVSSVPVLLHITPAAGIDATGNDKWLRIYPNPAADHITIVAEGGGYCTGDVATVALLNDIGQTVYSTELVTGPGRWSAEVQLKENIANGYYLLRLRAGGWQIIKQLIIQR